MTKYINCTKDQQGNCIRLLANLLRMVTCWRHVVEQVFFPFVERQVETSKVSIKENFSQCNTVAQTSQCEGAACGEDTRGVGLLLHLNDPVRHLYIKQVLNCHNPVVFSSRAGHTMKKMEPHFFFVTLSNIYVRSSTGNSLIITLDPFFMFQSFSVSSFPVSGRLVFLGWGRVHILKCQE